MLRSQSFRRLVNFSRMSSSLVSEFEAAKSRSTKLPEDPGNEAKLKMYALFKQATVGKCEGKRPSMVDFVGRAKYDAWKSIGDISKDDAMKQYIGIVDKLGGGVVGDKVDKNAEVFSTAEDADLVVSRKVNYIKMRLNRPKKYNAITLDMYDQIGKTLKEADDDDSVAFAVLTGSGDFYCSGTDLGNFKELAEMGLDKAAKFGHDVLKAYLDAVISFKKPIICLVNGPCLGIACTTMGLCDVAYASDSSFFQTPFSTTAQSPEGCSSYLFPRYLGMSMAMDMLIFDRKLSPDEAMRHGLISRVFPHSSFTADTQALLDVYSKLPKGAMLAGRGLVRENLRGKLLAVNKRECEVLAERWMSEEYMTAMAKFFARKSKSSL